MLNQFSLSITNMSLIMSFPKTLSMFANDCLIHSTVASLQARCEGGAGHPNSQYTLLIDGLSTKLLNTNRNERVCLAQLSLPLAIHYLTQTKVIDVAVDNLQVIVYDIIQLLKIVRPSDQRLKNAHQVQTLQTQTKAIDRIMESLQKILTKTTLDDVFIRLNTGTLKLLREHGNKELICSFRPIEFAFTRISSTRLETSLSVENLRIHDSDSVFDLSARKCSTFAQISVASSMTGKHNVQAQINFNAMNLFTSQLMVRIDSTAVDLTGSAIVCSFTGLALNHMNASPAELSNYSASELQNNRIIYLSVMRIHYHQDVRDISITATDEIYCLWSALFHWNALQVFKDVKNIATTLFPVRSQAEQVQKEPRPEGKKFNINLKLDGKIQIAILLTNNGPEVQDKMIFKTDFLSMGFQNRRIVNIKCETLGIYFNDVHNCDIEVSFLS